MARVTKQRIVYPSHSHSFISIQIIWIDKGPYFLSSTQWMLVKRIAGDTEEQLHWGEMPSLNLPCGSSSGRHIILILIQIHTNSDTLFSLFYEEQEYNLILQMWRLSFQKRYNKRVERQLWLRACTDLAGDQNLVPSTQVKQLTTTCTASSKGIWYLQHP